MLIALLAGPLPAQQKKAPGKHSGAFHWLDPARAAEQLAHFRTFFADELKADEQADIKIISRVGVFQDSALVIIDARNKGTPEPWSHYFELYNFNFATREKARIAIQNATWMMRVRTLARIENSLMPDILITYKDCTECEAVELMMALCFDRSTRSWKTRLWSKGSDAFLVDSDDQIGDYLERYECLFVVQDMDGDRFDDVCVWCRISELDDAQIPKVHSVKHVWTLYSVKNGESHEVEVQGKSEQARLRTILCSKSPKHILCGRKQ